MKLILVAMQPAIPLADLLLERTCELGQRLSYVEAAQLVSRRSTAEGAVESVQHWRLRAAVPALLRAHLAEGLLDWRLSLIRQPGAMSCQWRAESAAQRVSGRCDGRLEIGDAAGGRGSRLALDWELQFQSPGLRSMVGTLLTRYWRGLAEAASQQLATSAQAS
ncbi:MAG: hypothetical protein E6Q67_00370 [Roseateles sp.]|nr:MAG: hypothetical protein E6Q67_00370 [Roseateles sp.]